MSINKGSFRIFPEKYGYFPYVFLIYLSLPAYFIAHESGWKMVVGWGLLLLFLVSYRQLYTLFGSQAFSYWIVVQLGIIFVFTVFFNFNNVFLGFFTSYFLGWYRDTKSFLPPYLLFVATLSLLLIMHYEDLASYYYVVYLVIMFIVPFGTKSMNSRIELEKQLTEANEKIKELVKREERVRIARDLHDTLGHTLSLITLKSQLVAKLTGKDAKRAEVEAKEIERTSRIALRQVRELVSDMRSVSIAEVLVESESILQSAGISYQFKGEIDTESITAITQNILSMCLKEAITNVVKHSEAKNCHVILKQTAGEILLIIKDDGIGFYETPGSGNGIQGISERLELVDGQLKISSQQGTELTFSIPVVLKEEGTGAS